MDLDIKSATQLLVHGTEDDVVPVSLSRDYRDAKKKRGESVDLMEFRHAGHFELIDPRSAVWAGLQDRLLKFLT